MYVNLPTTNNSSLLSRSYRFHTSGKRHRQAEQRVIPESKLKKAERHNLKNPSSKRLKENSANWSTLDLTKHADLPKKNKTKLYKHSNKAGKYLAYLKEQKADAQMISSVVDLMVNYHLTTKSLVIHS